MKKITQSFIIEMRDYLNGGSCGHIIREKWINDRLLGEGSKAVKLGAYFEYIFTEMMLGKGKGSLPKDGKIPQPEMMASGKDMLAPYRLAHVNAERLKNYFDLMGIKILSAGERLTKGKFEGTLDLICQATKDISWSNGMKWLSGYRFVTDLKYAGTIDDKWSPYGWGQMTIDYQGSFISPQKAIHGTQAIQYHYITGLPFYFMVISSTNDIDVKFFKVEVTKDHTTKHIAEGNDLFEKLKFYNEIGWEPRPEISKCAECPLKIACNDKAIYPQIEIVNL